MSTEAENTPTVAGDTQEQDSTVSALTPDQVEPAFGWTRYAEIINGRFAMIGFVALLLLEFFTHQDFFSWAGLR
ncbi:MAG TPA: chlorophyll a/b-binding protein [Trichocoleus sp.]